MVLMTGLPSRDLGHLSPAPTYPAGRDRIFGLLRDHQTAVEVLGLIGFVAGLGGILFGNAPVALAGFGVMALAETAIVVQWAFVTVPAGLVLIFAAIVIYLIH